MATVFLNVCTIYVSTVLHIGTSIFRTMCDEYQQESGVYAIASSPMSGSQITSVADISITKSYQTLPSFSTGGSQEADILSESVKQIFTSGNHGLDMIKDYHSMVSQTLRKKSTILAKKFFFKKTRKFNVGFLQLVDDLQNGATLSASYKLKIKIKIKEKEKEKESPV